MKRKRWVFKKLANIFLGTGRVIIHAKHFVSLAEETLAQMRTDKSAPPVTKYLAMVPSYRFVGKSKFAQILGHRQYFGTRR
jgi:hypothetical protein